MWGIDTKTSYIIPCAFFCTYIKTQIPRYIYLGRLNELPTSLGINAHFYLHRLKLITFFIVFYSVDKRLLICILGNRADKWKSIPILYLLTVVKLVRVHFFSPNNFRNKIPFQLNGKGHLISKCPFGVIVWTKIPMKFFQRFLP